MLLFLVQPTIAINDSFKSDNYENSVKLLNSDEWPMFMHDSVHTGYSSSPAPNTNKILWTTRIAPGGKHVYKSSQPSVANGIVFFQYRDEDEHPSTTYALNVTTGNLLWSMSNMGSWDATPAIYDEKVFVGTYDGELLALHVYTGTLIWNFSGGRITKPPTVADGFVFFVTETILYCLDVADGHLIWEYEFKGICSSATVAEGKVFLQYYDDNVCCLDEYTGDVIWDVVIEDAQILGPPPFDDGKLYITVMKYGENAEMYALNATSGEQLWVFKASEYYLCHNPSIAYGNLYFGTEPEYYTGTAHLHCIDKTTGSKVWENSYGQSAIYGVPVVADGKVFFLVTVRGFWEAPVNVILVALDAFDGHTIWGYTFSKRYAGGTGLAIAYGKVFVKPLVNGVVYAFGSESMTSIEVQEIKSKSWSSLEIPFDDIDDAKDYVLNFVANGKPEADFGTIPMEITLMNMGAEPAENVVIKAIISGIAALASLDESDVNNDYVYLHQFEYLHSYSVGTIDPVSTKTVTLEIPVKYASVFAGIFKYNEDDEADVLFIVAQLNVDLEISGSNINKTQTSIKLTGVANPFELAAYTIVGVLDRLKEKMTNEVYQKMAEYVYSISGGTTITSFPITTNTQTINTQIESGTTSFSVYAFIPEGISLVELSVSVGTLILGAISYTALNGLAFLIIKPPDLRYGPTQITIKTRETAVALSTTENSFQNFTLTTISIFAENIHFDYEIPFENKTYYIHFNSNCTIFDIKFNNTKKMISYDIASQTGTIGFCNVTIPKQLLRENVTSSWKVKLNGTDIPFTSTDNVTHSFIYFNVMYAGMSMIEIIGTEVIPEFPTWMMLPVLMILTLLAIVLRKKRKQT